MSTHKHADLICLSLCLVILAAVSGLLLWKYPSRGTEAAAAEPACCDGLFNTASVHTIDIIMEDWAGFLDTCENEEYVLCDAVIDGETVRDAAIRAKGNTSLSTVKQYGNDRYSFKIEFDHYREGGNFQGLDKLSLNNLIQDNTCMKDYLTYQMMEAFGVAAPLCSYAWVTVNGEDWGLYLAVEAVEESFLERNYGGRQGELYKPDSMDMGGGRGAGEDFTMPGEFAGETREDGRETAEGTETAGEGELSAVTPPDGTMPQAMTPPEGMEIPEGAAMPGGTEKPEGMEMPGGGGGMGSDAVKLVYTDDDFDSYAHIFDNAKTPITDEDKTRLIRSLRTLNEGTEVETVVDTEAVIRYFVVHNFVCNFDSYTGSMIHNYYLYEEEGVLSMIPWDYNLAFGGFMTGGSAAELVNFPVDDPVSGGGSEDRPMLNWILQSEEYTALYHQYFGEFLAQFFDSGAFRAELERVTALIAPYVEKDPTAFCTYEAFLTGVETLEEFCLLRAESVRGQLAGTIPADSQGQAASPETLVEASHLTISDMGSMGMGGQRETESPVGGETGGEGETGTEGFAGGPPGRMEGGGPQNGEFPQRPGGAGGEMFPPEAPAAD